MKLTDGKIFKEINVYVIYVREQFETNFIIISFVDISKKHLSYNKSEELLSNCNNNLYKKTSIVCLQKTIQLPFYKCFVSIVNLSYTYYIYILLYMYMSISLVNSICIYMYMCISCNTYNVFERWNKPTNLLLAHLCTDRILYLIPNLPHDLCKCHRRFISTMFVTCLLIM